MASAPWDAQGEARDALRAIVADPRYGSSALSNAQTMTNLLKDMLPDAPRESSVLVAASEVGVIGILQTHMSNGMDLTTASRLAAGSFESQTALTPEACHWAVGAFASALRLDAVRQAPPVRDAAPSAGNGQPTMTAGFGAAAGIGVAPGRRGGGKPTGLRIGAVAAVGVAAILLVWSCALTAFNWSSGPYSFFSIAGIDGRYGGTWWNAIGPIVVAVLGIAAAVVLLTAHADSMRGLAAGLLMAFGLSTILVYATYAFTLGPAGHPGPAEAVGAIGGLLLLVAGVLALVGRKAGSGSLSG